ncbi:MAG: N-acetylmuramic acid 6-phosphate etherase [Clostridia bacterium]|nr:N-acetylmuramic acid 6-phosphate etherase [Clostridia bacterium]
MTMRDNYDALKTEGRNPRTMNIDKMSTLEAMRLMNDENKVVTDAIETQLAEIAQAVDLIAAAMERGGHLIYVGAGTSGRLGVIDAAECPPTFGVDHALVRGIIAGGEGAMFRAVENAEDSEDWGRRAIDEDGVQAGDVVVGISAAGRAPFVLGALKRARELGATPIGVTCNPDSLFVPLCDVTIAAYVGPEVISGSTRLKAGTAQKLILNMLSTGAMIKTGKVYSNLMINVKPTNEKLWERATRIIMQIADIDHDRAGELLKKHGSIRAALGELGLL